MEKPLEAADYWATDFQIKAGQWILEYTDAMVTEEEAKSERRKIYFVSTDQGKTFVPQTRRQG